MKIIKKDTSALRKPPSVLILIFYEKQKQKKKLVYFLLGTVQVQGIIKNTYSLDSNILHVRLNIPILLSTIGM